MKILFIFFLCSLLSMPVLAEPIITEIMYHPSPEQGGNYNEWLELFNPSPENITLWNWSINQRTMETIIIPPISFLVLAEKPDHPSWNVTNITLAEAPLLSFHDAQDTINLSNGSAELIHSYNKEQGGTGNGYSLCLFNGSWQECVSTPGKENTVETSLTPLPSDCNPGLSFFPTQTIYRAGEKFTFDFMLNVSDSLPFVIEYWIEDLFGEIAKPALNTTSVTQKHWTITTTEPEKTFRARAVLFPECNDTDFSDNFAEVLFVALNNQSTAQQEPVRQADSTLAFIKLPSSATAGKVFPAEIKIYKGDTNKYSIKLFVEQDGKKISEISKIKMPNKFTAYELSVPLVLREDCFAQTADVVLEGLGLEVAKNITVISDCSEAVAISTEEQQSHLSYTLQNASQDRRAGEIFDLLVNLRNDAEPHAFAVWGYVYRGSACYSCEAGEREANQITTIAAPSAVKTIQLPLLLDHNLKPGDYNIKVRIRKDEQKTTTDLTGILSVLPAQNESVTSGTQPIFIEQETPQIHSLITTATSSNISNEAYSSPATRARKLIPYILLSVFFFCLVFLVKKL